MSDATPAAGDGTAASRARATGGGDSPGRGTRGTGGYWTLFVAMVKHRVAHLRRYPVNTLSGLANAMILFAVIFFGGRALDSRALADSLEGIIVGFFLFSIATTAFAASAWGVTRESQWGTLEQLYMSPLGFGPAMLTRTVVRLIESFVWGAGTLAFMLLLTGETLAFPVVTLLVVGVLAVAPALGMGFGFAALALLYKRVENIFQVVNFAFVGLISAPVSGVVWARLLPVSQGSYVLGLVMREGRRLWELPSTELGLLVATAIGYFVAGYAVFMWASRRAREQGLMGHY